MVTDLAVLALGPSALALLALSGIAMRARSRARVQVPTLYLIFSSREGAVKSDADSSD